MNVGSPMTSKPIHTQSPKAFFGHLIDLANTYPDALALCSDSGMTSLSDLIGNVVSAAKVLRKKNVRGRHTVCLCCNNPDLNFVLALSLMINGCRVGYSKDLSIYKATGVKIDLVLTDKAGKVDDLPTMAVSQEWFQPKKPIATLGLPIAQDFSAIFSSSGSTGRPKLIEFSARAILHRIGTKGQDAYFPSQKRFLLSAGRGSLSVFVDTMVAVAAGGVLINAPANNSPTVIAAIQRYCPSYVLIAPALLAEVIEDRKTRPIRTRVPVARVTGAFCPPALVKDAVEVLIDEIVTSYGATEVARIAWKSSTENVAEERCVGKVIDGVEAAAFTDDNVQLPAGQEGLIRARVAPEIVGRYIGKDAGNGSALIDGWFPTGDIGRVSDDGYLTILGRSSVVINYGGNKLHPGFLEQALLGIDGVSAAAVVGVEADDGFPRICAAIVASRPIGFDAANWHLIETDFDFPVHVVKCLESLPKLATGKIDKLALQSLFKPDVNVPMVVSVPDQS